jgi:hypothetical protein
MSITALCPSCGNGLKAPEQLAGKRIKCLQCQTFFTLAGAGTATAVAAATRASRPAAGRSEGTGAVRLAFWLGLASLTLGLAAALTHLFAATAGYSRTLAWLGILLGGGAVALAIVREECGFGYPFAGTATSLLSLALVALWLGAAPGPDRGPGGFPPGGPGGMGQGPPPDGKGGPWGDKGKGPPPEWKGGPPGERDKGGPPPPPPQ